LRSPGSLRPQRRSGAAPAVLPHQPTAGPFFWGRGMGAVNYLCSHRDLYMLRELSCTYFPKVTLFNKGLLFQPRHCLHSSPLSPPPLPLFGRAGCALVCFFFLRSCVSPLACLCPSLSCTVSALVVSWRVSGFHASHTPLPVPPLLSLPLSPLSFLHSSLARAHCHAHSFSPRHCFAHEGRVRLFLTRRCAR